MYGPRPIRFPAHWCADYSKYRGFLAGGISTASSLLPCFGTRLRRQNFLKSRTHTIPPATQAKEDKELHAGTELKQFSICLILLVRL